MAYYSQEPYRVACEWGVSGIQNMSASFDVTVVIDVLSFCTAIDVAASRGATVFPFRWKDEKADDFGRSLDAHVAQVRGAGTYSLSPETLTRLGPGDRLVLPSQNGAMLSLAARSKVVMAACLRNRRAVADWIARADCRVLVAPAGERWPDDSLRPAIEDVLGAGAICSLLGERQLSPECRAAAATFDALCGDLRATMLDCTTGRELSERGYEGDVHYAAELDCSSAVVLASRPKGGPLSFALADA